MYPTIYICKINLQRDFYIFILNAASDFKIQIQTLNS